VGSNKVSDEKFRSMVESVAPVTLPARAYGPKPLEWLPQDRKSTVWAWVQWPDRPAERVAAHVEGFNDRVVIVTFSTPTGTRQVCVWRNAVRRRGQS
jgi:hypothetical protein